MRRLLLLLPLGLLAGCYYPYDPYGYGYYGYQRPPPPPYSQGYAPYQPPYTSGYPQQNYRPEDQSQYQGYGQQPGYYQGGGGQPTNLAPPAEGQYQQPPQGYGAPQPGYGGSAANCGTAEQPRAC